MANPKEKTPMCLVNELARFNRIQPQYKLLNERGPAHAKVSNCDSTVVYICLEKLKSGFFKGLENMLISVSEIITSK